MLVLRLSRTGRRNQPKFRLVVAEDRSKLTGKPVAILGHYQPTDKNKPLVMDKDAVSMWLSRGAQPSNTVAKILNGEGFDLKVHQYQPGKPKKEPKEAPAPTAASVEASEEPAASQEEVPAEVTATEEAPAEPVSEESAPEAPVAEEVASETPNEEPAPESAETSSEEPAA